MKVFINYGDKRYYFNRLYSKRLASKTGGFDRVISYSRKDIDKHFFKTNKRVLKQPRGGGYWLWKPYFVDKTLQQLSDGDFLFYCDSDFVLTNSVDPLFQLIITRNQDIIPFVIPHIEKEWTKRDTFILMNCDTQNYHNTLQRASGYFVLRKSALSVKFVREWLSLIQDERIVTDIPNQMGKPNYPGFQENRHDQSIFSLLSKKYHLSAENNSFARSLMRPIPILSGRYLPGRYLPLVLYRGLKKAMRSYKFFSFIYF